jgi:flagellar biogenesis protein FliO
MTGAYVQMVMALAAVIGMILFMRFFLKKKQGGSGMMNVLAYQSFGPRKGLAALKMGKEVLLLGITSTDIKLLKTFDENQFEARAAAEINNKLKMLKDMKERLNERQ